MLEVREYKFDKERIHHLVEADASAHENTQLFHPEEGCKDTTLMVECEENHNVTSWKIYDENELLRVIKEQTIVDKNDKIASFDIDEDEYVLVTEMEQKGNWFNNINWNKKLDKIKDQWQYFHDEYLYDRGAGYLFSGILICLILALLVAAPAAFYIGNATSWRQTHRKQIMSQKETFCAHVSKNYFEKRNCIQEFDHHFGKERTSAKLLSEASDHAALYQKE